MRQKEIITDCLSEESIARVVKQNPNITVAAVYKREKERLAKTGRSLESIRSEFTQAISNLLGNDTPIKANGSRVFEGKESIQLTIFDL